MSVRKRKWAGGEAWIADFRDREGNRIVKQFALNKEAVEFHEANRQAIRQGTHISTKLTVAEAGKNWLENAKQGVGRDEPLERSTTRFYGQMLKDHIDPLIGHWKLSELGSVDQFERMLKGKGCTKATTKRAIACLGSILADAGVRNIVRDRPKRKSSGRHDKRIEVGVDLPTLVEANRIIHASTGRWRPLLITAIFTGLRASELRGLPWEHVDLDHGEIHVKQRADRFNEIGSPKSKGSIRTVPIGPFVVNVLKAWKEECPKGPHDLVFPNGSGNIEDLGNIIHRGLVAAQLRAGIVDKAGKAKYTGMHCLRHFYASWCINRQKDGGLGLDPKIVQARLGHSKISMTLDTYGHLFRGDDAEEIAAAERRLLEAV